MVVFLEAVFLVVVFLTADFLVVLVVRTFVFLAGAVFSSSRLVASSRVIVLGSRSVGILRLFGRGRPLPEAGLIAGPLI